MAKEAGGIMRKMEYRFYAWLIAQPVRFRPLESLLQERFWKRYYKRG